MAESRTFSQGQHRRHPPPLIAQSLMTDREDSAVDPVQAPRTHPPVNRVLADTAVDELVRSHDAVLPGG